MKRLVIPSLILWSLIGCSRESGKAPAGNEKADVAPIGKTFGTAPVKVTIEMSANEITTADSLICRLIVNMPEDFEADVPDWMFPEDVPGAVLTDYEDSDTTTDGKRRLVREYEVEPMYEGTLTLPALEIYYHKNEEVAEHMLATEPLEVVVKETPASAEVLALKGPRGLVTVERMKAEQRRVWLMVLAGVAGVTLAVVLLLFWARRPRPEPASPPAHEIAMDRLRALVTRKLVEQGEIEPFFVEITAIVRDYIEQAFDLRAPEQTTEEFLLNIGSAPAIARHEETLKPFLTAADEVKFALARPEPTAIQHTFDTARDFILQTSQARGGPT